VEGEVFNVGATAENYRKLDLVAAIREQIHAGTVSYVERHSDPRDYRVSCEKITRRLAFHTTMTVPEGIAEIAAALSAGSFPEPFDDAYRNSP
jgi:nucleoside-diphosphate-sugar epimerase